MDNKYAGYVSCLAILILLLFFIPDPTLGGGAENCSFTVPTISVNSPASGSTNRMGNDHDCGRGHAGPDVVYEFYVPTAGPFPYEVILEGKADYDADWAVASVCDSVATNNTNGTAGDIGCWDYIFTNSTPPPTYDDMWGRLQVTVSFGEAGYYYIWVDGHYPNAKGNYVLEVQYAGTPTPTPSPAATPSPTPTPTCPPPTATPTP